MNLIRKINYQLARIWGVSENYEVCSKHVTELLLLDGCYYKIRYQLGRDKSNTPKTRVENKNNKSPCCYSKDQIFYHK